MLRIMELFRKLHSCNQSITRGVLPLLLLALIALPHVALANTSYLTLNNGQMHVFPDTCVSSVTRDKTHIVFTARDGRQFSYLLSMVQSVDSNLPKDLPTVISYQFNNEYNYQVIGDAVGRIQNNKIDVTVIGIGKRLTADFSLSSNHAVAYVDDVAQESRKSRLRFDPSQKYVVGYPGDQILLPTPSSGYAMHPYGREYTVTVDYVTDRITEVPRIDINTVGGENISSKEYYLDAEIIIDGMGVFPSMTDSVKIKGRGNTSWSTNPNAKNPYRLKFASKKKPLGLPAGKNWVLLANNMLGSQLTNAYGMKASSLIGTVAVNHIIPVDLYVNGTYKGSYNFTEKVGLSNNSVDLPDESAAALLELDRYYDEPEGQKFRSEPDGIPVNIKSPEFGVDPTIITLNDISSRFNAFVQAVENGEDLEPFVDIDKLARYLLANELICNKEIFHPKSTFLYHENILEDSCRFIFGPMWDLDWGCGYVMNTPSSYFKNLTTYDFFNQVYTGDQYWFFNKLSKNRKLTRRMCEIMNDFMGEPLDELCEFCGEYYSFARTSIIRSRTAFPDYTSYLTQSGNAPNWFRTRAEFIANRLNNAAALLLGDVDGDGRVSIDDVVMLIDHLLGDSPIDEQNADIDGNGKISIDDVVGLIDLLLSDN